MARRRTRRAASVTVTVHPSGASRVRRGVHRVRAHKPAKIPAHAQPKPAAIYHEQKSRTTERGSAAVGVIAAAALVGLGIFLFTRESKAAPELGPGGAPGGPGGAGGAGGGGGSGGGGIAVQGPGTPTTGLIVGGAATVIAPDGLRLRSGAATRFLPTETLSSKAINDDPHHPGVKGDTLRQGSVVTVVSTTGDGWVEVQVPGGRGFVCNDCPQAPGGPWLKSTPGAAPAIA